MENLTAISIFITVIEAKSFSAAAKKLGMVRSAVSRHITALETTLSTRLIHRTTRQLSLTAAGERYYARVSVAVQAIREAEKEIDEDRIEPIGKVVAAIPMSFGLMHILPGMAEFQQKHPKITIDLRLDDKKINLLTEGVDVALRIAELSDSTLVAKRIAHVRNILVATKSYLDANGTPTTPQDLQDHACLLYTLGASPAKWSFHKENHVSDINISSQFSASNSLAIREMALAGIGIALIPDFLVIEDLKTGRLMQLLDDWQSRTLEISVVYPSRRYVPKSVREFIAFLEERTLLVYPLVSPVSG
ncbi:LysR family transcriptional regulator [Pseudomonas putida]|uniref:LysR family transcriptional regulator n=1 Tax=Pseudomonas putida TaxID=303 RepID=UPI0009BB4D63|nr:LysR family transcriptional regulator [Pseudomonas putida]